MFSNRCDHPQKKKKRRNYFSSNLLNNQDSIPVYSAMQSTAFFHMKHHAATRQVLPEQNANPQVWKVVTSCLSPHCVTTELLFFSGLPMTDFFTAHQAWHVKIYAGEGQTKSTCWLTNAVSTKCSAAQSQRSLSCHSTPITVMVCSSTLQTKMVQCFL